MDMFMLEAEMNRANVRYQVRALDPSIDFYTKQLGFKLDMRNGPFAQLSLGSFALILSSPGTSGARDMPDGRKQEPGGWTRILVWVDDLQASIAKLKQSGARFRNEIESGPGGSQILVEDPDGNPVELHQPAKD